MRKLCYLHEIISPKRLTRLQRFHQNKSSFQPLFCKRYIFQSYFSSYTINRWNKLDLEIRRIDSYVCFRTKLLSFIKPTEDKTFSIYSLLRIKLLTRLMADFSHKHKYKSRHNFANKSNSLHTIHNFFSECTKNMR